MGTRSIGYLTKLLKPKFDNNNFEESFTTWEIELARFERDNGSTLPDTVKIAVLLNETTGPLEQHLQLLAGAITTYALCTNQNNNHGILQSNNSLYKVGAATRLI